MKAAIEIRPRTVRFLAIAGFHLLCGLYLGSSSVAQPRIEGRITNASTGEVLPGATVQIEDRFIGTIANDVGRYVLGIPSYPVTIITRFIGFESDRRSFETQPEGPVDIALRPSSMLLAEIVVTGEDPAIGIMRRVIEEKARWRDSFDTYKVDAYNRFRMENDSGIVSIWESGTVAYWDRKRGIREVSIWQRQTDNMNVDDMLPAALFVQNLYDDDIEVAGHRLMGVTHPDALSYYRFRLAGTRARDGRLVYDIDVEPRSKLGSGLVGGIGG
ncbi:MAG: carboxypeptidase-like regulatory domain-containing protein, partial [Bacteroidetes bacterium]|nr:carboxypeptidase-like regulatory domain-containing protein [Bacteroidota bacterium]